MELRAATPSPRARPVRRRRQTRLRAAHPASLLAALLAGLLSACMAGPSQPLVDYPARQHLMVGLVLERPRLLQEELDTAQADRDAVDFGAWKQAQERQAAYQHYVARRRRSNEALFEGLVSRQTLLQQERQRRQRERWSQYLTSRPREQVQAKAAKPKASPGDRWARFTQQTEQAQASLQAREQHRKEAWAQYNAQNRAATQARLEEARKRRERWAAFHRAESVGQTPQERQREAEQRWVQFSRLQGLQPAPQTGTQAVPGQ